MQECVDAATARYHELGDSIKAAEKRLAEIAVLKARYSDYRKAKEEMQELLRAQKNIELFFDEEKKPEQTEHSRYTIRP